MQSKHKKIILIVILVILFVGIDQFIKSNVPKEEKVVMINNIININYVQNTGAAFGIGTGNTAEFIIISLIIIGMVLRFIITQIDRVDRVIAISLTLILAGGIGNLIDRIALGYVVDYIDVSPIFSFPVFNLADAYITIGWILFVISVVINYIKEKKKGNS